MAKSKKRNKLNNAIRKFFDGDGFDEGIERLSTETLTELVQALGIIPESWDRPDLIRLFRRLWSEGELETRQGIVTFFKGENRHYPSTKVQEPSLERSEKIAAIMEEMQLSREEELLLFNAFIDVRAKKITKEKLEAKLEHIRFEAKRHRLEQTLKGGFDLEDRFEFNAPLHYELLGESFNKIYTLHTPAFSYSYLKTQDEEALIEEITRSKTETAASTQHEVDAFCSSFSVPHAYLDAEQIVRAFKSAPPTSTPTRPPLSDELFLKLLNRDGEISSISQFDYELVLEAPAHYTPPPGKQSIAYALHISMPKEALLEKIWRSQPLELQPLIEREKAHAEAAFNEEVEQLAHECAEHAKLLELTDAELYGTVYDLLLPQLHGQLHVSPKESRRILYRFSQNVQGALQRRQRQQLLARTIRDFKNLFPLARSLRRKLVLHIGPTNSGKTYTALQQLKKADTGYYLAPLRLLALEGYENLREYGLETSLITGEEQITSDEATHISSTIEMLNFDADVDVCVIDEVQMLGDRDRGWAWANAIIGAPASTVIMTGSPNCRQAVEALAEYLGEPLEVVEFERMNPLTLLRTATPMAEIQSGTAIVAFSRKEVLRLKQQLTRYYKVSVVYGNLSPEVRREEARRFREKETDILVATDAIAMGLNLPIQTILFYKAEKFDGEKQRPLTPSEIHQIAGRSGRYGISEKGYVGALKPDVLKIIHQEFPKPAKPITIPFNVMANLEHIKLVGTILEERSLFEILQFFVKNMEFSGPFRAANLEGMLEAAQIIDRYDLELSAKFHLACAPVSLSSPYIVGAYERYVRALEKGLPVPYIPPRDLGEYADSMEQLLEAEDRVKEISLYLWLAYRFSDFFIDTEKARDERGVLNRYIENSLKQSHFVPRCRECTKPLPLNSQYAICQSCFRRLHRPDRPQKPRYENNKS